MSSDVRDVLNLPSRPAPKPPVAKRQKTESAMKKMGRSTTAANKNRVWSGFKNQAREDGLVLHHWVRGAAHQEDEEYPFAKYSQSIRVPRFDRQDYDEAFADDSWSYDETCYLFGLCKEYDLRWVVIHDRYDFAKDSSNDNEKKDGQNEKAEGEDSDEKKAEKEQGSDVDSSDEADKNESKEDADADAMDVDEEEPENADVKSSDDKESSGKDDDDSSKDAAADKSNDEKKIEKTAEENQEKTGAVAAPDTQASRTIEDLKLRFYGVCRALLKLQQTRSGIALSPAEEDLYKQMKFSKSNELQRKAHLENLLKRSPAEIAEEEALVIESRKLEAAAERMLMERAELLKLLDAPQASGSIAQYQSSQGLAQLTSTLLTTDKTRKRKDATSSVPGSPSHESAEQSPVVDGSVSSVSASASTGPGASNKSSHDTPTKTKSDEKNKGKPSDGSTDKTGQRVKNEKDSEKAASATPSGGADKDKKTGAAAVAQLIQKKLTAKEEAAYGISYHDKLSPGVSLRSSKITTLKATVQAKVSGVLNELGLPSRPTMPTAKVTAKFESLQQSISVLLEAKKQLDKLDTEVRILKTQRETAK
ncbi:Swc4p [Sugiyamaella lignohabitans]|uniref:SWR1-complex protein 4 n=1 Tax=Sugiyamaella lignohabitans TaxID=796027 RepID=A0A161HK67_9ASCO|nr:Swc4p [Sugiyamaella lignohabitans]ANB11978.1 Swc4p [Sugiyamaella lignohabitans]